MCSCIHEVLPKPRTPIQSPGLLQSFHFMDGITTNTFRYFEILVIVVKLTLHPPLNMQKKKCNDCLKLNRHFQHFLISYHKTDAMRYKISYTQSIPICFSSGHLKRNWTFSLSCSLTGGYYLENTYFSLSP